MKKFIGLTIICVLTAMQLQAYSDSGDGYHDNAEMGQAIRTVLPHMTVPGLSLVQAYRDWIVQNITRDNTTIEQRSQLILVRACMQDDAVVAHLARTGAHLNPKTQEQVLRHASWKEDYALLLTLRLEQRCSLESLSTILKEMGWVTDAPYKRLNVVMSMSLKFGPKFSRTVVDQVLCRVMHSSSTLYRSLQHNYLLRPMVQQLLAAGANPEACNEEGKSAIDLSDAVNESIKDLLRIGKVYGDGCGRQERVAPDKLAKVGTGKRLRQYSGIVQWLANRELTGRS